MNVVLPVPAMARHITHVGLPAQHELVPEDSWLLAVAGSADDTLLLTPYVHVRTRTHVATIVLAVCCNLPTLSLINQLRMRSLNRRVNPHSFLASWESGSAQLGRDIIVMMEMKKADLRKYFVFNNNVVSDKDIEWIKKNL